jgi:hypothetical protein
MKLLAFAVFAVSACLAQTPDAVLDDWHKAAAAADEARYFGHFAPQAVFMGTDPRERWNLETFRAWAKPYFDRKKAWNFTPHDRHVTYSGDRLVAWFDEMLNTPNLGECRGSGVLLRLDGEWKIAQYNLSIPIPNGLADSVVKEIKAGTRP